MNVIKFKKFLKLRVFFLIMMFASVTFTFACHFTISNMTPVIKNVLIIFMLSSVIPYIYITQRMNMIEKDYDHCRNQMLEEIKYSMKMLDWAIKRQDYFEQGIEFRRLLLQLKTNIETNTSEKIDVKSLCNLNDYEMELNVHKKRHGFQA